MKILFYFAHPAQYLFLRESIIRLQKNGIKVKILIKTKDVLENLLINDGLDYLNVLPKERKQSKLFIALSLFQRIFLILPIILKFKPNLLVSSDASIAQLGKLLNIYRITITEDDFQVVKTLAKLTYPFTNTILCPDICNVGKWEYKKTGYKGYMKLGYLHPSVFSIDDTIKNKYQLPDDFVIIRLSKLKAHHDFGISGITDLVLDKLILNIEKRNFHVFISCENPISDKYKDLKLLINPSDIHHILAAATFIVSDSQSMSVEAAMLGVPSIRYNDFAGRISVLDELEHKYNLTFGIKPGNDEKLFSLVSNLLSTPHLKEVFQSRRLKMLADKINVSAFLTWFIENYPESKTIIEKNPDYQYRFK